MPDEKTMYELLDDIITRFNLKESLIKIKKVKN